MLLTYFKTSAAYFSSIFLRIYDFGSVAVLLAIFGVLPANFKWQKRRKLFLELRDFFESMLEIILTVKYCLYLKHFP